MLDAFDHAGEERPFPLDVVPRVVSSADWDIIEPGVAQRVRAVEAFLDDVYGSQRCVSDGIVPRRLITSSQHFRRAAAGIHPPGGVRVHVSGIDIVRDQHGIHRVLEDNVRVPSGVSYVLSNRRAMSQMYSELFATMGIRPVLEYSQRLRKALAKVSNTPCRTRLLNLFEVEGGGSVMDLPGYGYAKASKTDQ